MGRFKKFKQPKIVTVIGIGTSIMGNTTFSGGLHVDGSIEGDVVSEPSRSSALTLSEHGVIKGDVRVPNIVLNGTVVGDVYASSRVELAPKAKVTGTVYYKLLEMAMGAEVNGQLVHTEEVEPRRLSFEGDESLDNEKQSPADAADVGVIVEAEQDEAQALIDDELRFDHRHEGNT